MNISNHGDFSFPIISYQAITGNNNACSRNMTTALIISYQAITGNNNFQKLVGVFAPIISYQAITGNNNAAVPPV